MHEEKAGGVHAHGHERELRQPELGRGDRVAERPDLRGQVCDLERLVALRRMTSAGRERAGAKVAA